jgi:hypothetical protein
VQQLKREAACPFDGAVPQPFDNIPRLLEASLVCRAHLRAVGVSPVELGVDQRTDVDAIDRHILDLTIDVDINQLDASHHRPLQINGAELCSAQVDGAKVRAAEVDALKPGATEVGTKEVSHSTTLTSASDDLPQRETSA